MLEFEELSQGPKTILCLPGLECSRAAIGMVVPHVQGEARLLWADYNRLRGLTHERAIAGIEEAIQREKPVAITAESFGSMLAISWALHHPEHRIPLILSGPLSWVRRRRFARSGRLLATLVPHPLQGLCVWIGAQFVIERRVPAPLRQRVIRDLSRIPRRAWLDRLAILLQMDLRPHLTDIRNPIILLWGSEDKVVFSVEEAEIFRAAGFADAIRLIPDVGHSVWAMAPTVVAGEVRRALNGGLRVLSAERQVAS